MLLHLRKRCLSPTGRLNLGFITKGKLAAVLITPSSWVPNSATHINFMFSKEFLGPLHISLICISLSCEPVKTLPECFGNERSGSGVMPAIAKENLSEYTLLEYSGSASFVQLIVQCNVGL